MNSGLIQQRTEDEEDNGGRAVDETRPLLSQQSQQGQEAASRSHQCNSLRKRFCVPLLFIIVAGMDFTVFMLNLPLTRVYESIICYRYFEAQEPLRFLDPASIPESLCKAEAIQEELALVRGYEQLFMALPGVLLALPYGTLADRWGRKPVLSLCAAGLAATLSAVLIVCQFWWIFPLRFVWIAWLLTTIGGGASVLVSTVFSILTDVTQEASRARVFLQLAVAILTAQAIATPLASIMMDKFGTGLPIAVGYSIGLSACLLTLLVPETTPTNKATDESESPTLDGRLPLWMAHVSDRVTKAIDSFEFLVKSPSILALVVSFLINTIGTSSIMVVIQYCSKRFSISISNAGLLLTIRAILTIFVFLVVLNLLGSLLSRWYGLEGPSRDLWLARLTVICAPFGFLLISLGQNIPLLAIGMAFTAFGSGSGSLMRSVATVMVHSDQVARIHAAISLVDTLGVLIAGPLLAETFALGLRMGNGWIALPFFLATALTALGSSIVWLVRIPKAINSGE